MRSWQITDGFGLDSLKLNEHTDLGDEALKAYDVRLKLHACSLNYRDIMVINGLYNPKFSLPLVPLSDGAGEVVEIGREVSSFKVGDRVCPTFSQKWCHGVASSESSKHVLGGPLNGTLCQYRTFNEMGLVKIPEHLSYIEASTLPCAAVTAFNAIAFSSGLRPGNTVLLEGSGGVSLFALQFAKEFGLKVVMISSCDEKLKKARSLYPLAGINYQRTPEWQDQVLDITDGQGVDAVIEVGGAATLPRAISCVKRGGTICLIGVLSGTLPTIDVRPVLMNSIRIQGIFVGAKIVFESMMRVIRHSEIRPVVDRVFAFDKVKSALSYLESQKHFGKVCIDVGE